MILDVLRFSCGLEELSTNFSKGPTPYNMAEVRILLRGTAHIVGIKVDKIQGETWQQKMVHLESLNQGALGMIVKSYGFKIEMKEPGEVRGTVVFC